MGSAGCHLDAATGRVLWQSGGSKVYCRNSGGELVCVELR
jgi:hypothetical protein